MATDPKVQAIRDGVDRLLQTRHEELSRRVRACVAETLAIEPATIAADASLIDELGAESIDFLDLVFRLETAYGVKIPRDGIRSAAQSGLASGFETGGVLTAEALDRLRVLMPEVPPERIVPGLRVSQIPSLFTPETFVRLVAWQLSEQTRPA